jgi:hypothetical protein
MTNPENCLYAWQSYVPMLTPETHISTRETTALALLRQPEATMPEAYWLEVCRALMIRPQASHFSDKTLDFLAKRPAIILSLIALDLINHPDIRVSTWANKQYALLTPLTNKQPVYHKQRFEPHIYWHGNITPINDVINVSQRPQIDSTILPDTATTSPGPSQTPITMCFSWSDPDWRIFGAGGC